MPRYGTPCAEVHAGVDLFVRQGGRRALRKIQPGARHQRRAVGPGDQDRQILVAARRIFQLTERLDQRRIGVGARRSVFDDMPFALQDFEIELLNADRPTAR